MSLSKLRVKLSTIIKVANNDNLIEQQQEKSQEQIRDQAQLN